MIFLRHIRQQHNAKAIFSAVEQTIVAPATPQGTSALSVIRISGPDTRNILKELFSCKAPKPRFATLATARDPETKKSIDSLVYIFYEGPNSYSGEDSAELFPHGNPLIIRQLIAALCKIPNVRMAQRGEFTRRAFLNGKMDLVQAESVADIIHAQTTFAIDNAQKLLSGKFSEDVQNLVRMLKDFSARTELDVDFVEEEVAPDFSGQKERLAKIRQQIQKLLDRCRSTSLNRKPKVVLYGAPNAGKSSLLNALLHENRVLVSDIPGTTRDYIEANLVLNSGEATIVDTAGIAAVPQNILDQRSMAKSEEAIQSADLAILLIDSSQQITDKVTKEIAEAKSKNHWIVLSKSDKIHSSFLSVGATIALSAKTSEGLSELCTKLDKTLFPAGDSSEDYWITNERECSALKEAARGLDRIENLAKNNPAIELIAFELRTVLDSLSEITGEISSEDILQTIFNGFCIGK